MIEEGNMNHTKCYNHINLAKKVMEDYSRSLYEIADFRDRVVTIEDDEYEDIEPQADDLLRIEDDFFIEASTGAQLSRNGAIGLLYQYCGTLPSDAYSNHIPDFKIDHAGIGYVCNITMPLNAPISVIKGEIQPSKKKAKQDAAFRACIELRRKGALTDRFFPYRVKLSHDERDPEVEGLMENNKRFSREYPFHNPTFWELESVVPTELFVTVIWLGASSFVYHGRRHRPLCLLTRKPLPEMPSLYIHGRGESTSALSKTFAQPVIATEDRLQTLSMFTIRLLSIAANKQFECDPASFSYWIAPVKLEMMSLITSDSSFFQDTPDKIISWEEVALAAKERWQEPKIQDLAAPSARQECLVYTKGEEGRRYYLREVRKDLCPLSSPPIGSRESDNGKYSRIIDWYLSYRPKLSVDLDQPIWEVILITRLFNYVRKKSIDEPVFPECTLFYFHLTDSKIEETMLFNSIDVCFEYGQSQRAVNGCLATIAADSGGCILDSM
jgi:endoribonuclease Dicer